MKSVFLKAGLLTCLLFGIIDEETSAESKSASKCSSFGTIEQNTNPSFQQINCLLTNAAIEADIPPEVVKAVAYQESDWAQFNKKNEPNISLDGGIGIMQVTDRSMYRDEDKLKYDITYNIEAGVKILSEKYTYDLPKVKDAGRQDIENWYFPVMAYNGTKAINSPVYQSNGEKNTKAYQEEVFSKIEKDSFLTDTKLAAFPFKSKDFVYESTNHITFLENKYTLNELHTSAYFLKKGDKVIVTGGKGILRKQPATSKEENNLAAKNTILTITNDFSYDVKSTSKNQFVWFPVKTADGKSSGFISSAYIKKMDASSIPVDRTAPSIPKVDPIADIDGFITGKAEKNAKVYAKQGTKNLGQAIATNGNFKIEIKKQSAGTKIAVYAIDALGNKSGIKQISVKDETPPAKPTASKITSKTVKVTGKSEKGATITIYKENKQIGKRAVDKKGKYTVTFKKQKKGSKVKIVAQDKAGNKSKALWVTVK